MNVTLKISFYLLICISIVCCTLLNTNLIKLNFVKFDGTIIFSIKLLQYHNCIKAHIFQGQMYLYDRA